MIAIDTNILVRFLTADDKAQFRKARALFENNEVFIPDTVILETEWVLRFAYKFPAGEICAAFDKLFGLVNVRTERPALLARAIQWHAQGLDFADAFHLSQCQKTEAMYTFDATFIRAAKGLGECPVARP